MTTCYIFYHDHQYLKQKFETSDHDSQYLKQKLQTSDHDSQYL